MKTKKVKAKGKTIHYIKANVGGQLPFSAEGVIRIWNKILEEEKIIKY